MQIKEKALTARKKLAPYPIALSVFFVFSIYYIVCISIKLLLTGLGIETLWQMDKIWIAILPGFTGTDVLSIIIGLFEVSVGSYAIAYILVPIYNFFVKYKHKNEKVEVKLLVVKFKTLFLYFAIFGGALFTLCVLYDMVVPNSYQILNFWKSLLPGFEGLTLAGYFTGLIVITVYSVYASFVFSSTINYFEKLQVKQEEKELGENFV